MNEKNKEVRKFQASNIEVREIENDQEKIITGYINKFNTQSQFMGFYEEIAPGAFNETLNDGHNIFAMYNHDSNMILGSTNSINKSLTLSVDNIGLRFSLIINENISYSNDIYELVKLGDIQGCSFAFCCLEDSWSINSDGADLRTVKKADLIEVTITPFPAYLDSEASCRSYEAMKKESVKAKELEFFKEEFEIMKLEIELGGI